MGNISALTRENKSYLNRKLRDLGVKMCCICGTVKGLEHFSKYGSGYQSRCKDCAQAIINKWLDNNPDYRKGGERRIEHRLNVVTYRGQHTRLDIERGKAREHKCAGECGSTAAEWAWNTTCSNFLLEEQAHGGHLYYCLHVDCYLPLCVLCHKGLDAKARKARSE